MLTNEDGYELTFAKGNREAYRQIDRFIVGRLEEHLGRVPSDDEVKQKGQKLIHPDKSWSFVWDGKLIASIDFLPDRVIMHAR
jgi:hypothetical protein